MPYRSAILAAIEELKDHETGSPAAAIRRCMQDRKDDLSAATDHHYSSASVACNNSVMDASNYKATTAVSTGSGGGSDLEGSTWNEALFQTTLKSLLAKNILVQVNGSNYKYSDAYLKKRAERLREQMEYIQEEEQRRRHQHHYSSLSTSLPAGAAISSLPSPSHAHYPREEPPKPSPKKKTLHAKVKINEGEIITVINPPTSSSQQHKHDHSEMETEDDMNINNNHDSTMILDAAATTSVANTNKVAKKQPHHVKIIPRKVVGGTIKKCTFYHTYCLRCLLLSSFLSFCMMMEAGYHPLLQSTIRDDNPSRDPQYSEISLQ